MPALYPLLRPLIHALDAETAHRLTLRALAHASWLPPAAADDPILASTAFGLAFGNPVGIAAGFDKDAVALPALMRLGLGFVEVGTVTPRPQAGNPRPRLFRLPEDGAAINRMGFNNAGVAALAARLRALPARPAPLVINIGANKDSPDRAADYVAGLTAVARLADLVAINVSSPNTPGLRGLQDRPALEDLLGRLAAVPDRPPLLLKIAPDLDDAALEDVAEVAEAAGIAGIVVGNTTTTRPAGLRSRHRGETGGLSGRPLFELSTERLRRLRRLTGGRMPLVGVGGIDSGRAAYEKIRAGASLVQLYTALVYQGPGLIGRINRELAQCLMRDGFASVAAAVGA